MSVVWRPLGPAEALPHLESAVAVFAATLATGDLGAAVSPCPGWDLRALAHHLGNVHCWARAAIIEGHPDTGPVDAPPGRDALVQWYRDCASGLVDVLRTVDPEQPCWTFGFAPQTARFWFRRQAHETTIHALDAVVSQGHPAPALDRTLALDGIDEVVGMFFPRQVRLARIPPLARSLALVPTDFPAGGGGGGGGGADGPLRWVLAGDGTATASPYPHAPADTGVSADVDALAPSGRPDLTPDVAVQGPAEVLLQLLWHRTRADDRRLQVIGDRAALDEVLAQPITP